MSQCLCESESVSLKECACVCHRDHECVFGKVFMRVCVRICVCLCARSSVVNKSFSGCRYHIDMLTVSNKKQML